MALIWKTFTNTDQLALISADWNSLNSKHNNGCLFTSPHWLLNWIKHYWQDNWHLYSFAVYKDKELIALLPLYFQRNSKILSQKNMFLIGQGEEELSEVSSEYLDILIHEHYSAQLIPYCREKLINAKADSFSARAIHKNANILKVIPKDQYNLCGIQYVVPVNQWETSQLSKNTKAKIKRTHKKLSTENAQFIWVEDHKKIDYWNKMAQFHQKRWVKKKYAGAFSQDTFHHFHRSLICESNTTAMSAICINDDIVAINYYLVDNEHYYFYQSGWDEENFNHLSPGFALHIWSIENCNVPMYDFMMGNSHDSYKSKFQCEQHDLFTILVHYKPIKQLFVKCIQKIFLN